MNSPQENPISNEVNEVYKYLFQPKDGPFVLPYLTQGMAFRQISHDLGSKTRGVENKYQIPQVELFFEVLSNGAWRDTTYRGPVQGLLSAHNPETHELSLYQFHDIRLKTGRLKPAVSAWTLTLSNEAMHGNRPYTFYNVTQVLSQVILRINDPIYFPRKRDVLEIVALHPEQQPGTSSEHLLTIPSAHLVAAAIPLAHFAIAEKMLKAPSK